MSTPADGAPTWPRLGGLELEDILDELRSRAQASQDAQRTMTGLLDAVVAVSSDLDLSLVLGRIVRSACDLVAARYGALGVLSPSGEHLVEFVTHGVDEAAREQIGDLPHGRGVLGLLIRDPRPRRLRDIAEHPDSFGFPPGHPPMSSFLGTPVSIRGEVFGNLYLAQKLGAEEFSADDESVLVALAAAAGVAIDNARLYDRTHRQRRLADAVGELTQHLLEGGGTDAALQVLADRCTELTGADVAVVALYDVVHGPAAERRLVVRAVSHPAGRAGDVAQGVGELLGPGRWDDVVATREPLLLIPAPDHAPGTEAAAVRRWRSGPDDGPTALVPIAVGEAELGLLAVAWHVDADSVATASVEPLGELGRSAALALEAASAQRARGRTDLLEDRDRIARDMHDHVIQRLFATGLSLQAASRITTDSRVGVRLEEAVDELDAAIKDIRQTIFALRRRVDAPTLGAELGELVDQAAVGLGWRPEVEVARELDDVPPDLAQEVLAVLREGLSNVVRHAGARWCRVRVSLDDDLTVEVADDGVGVDPDAARSGLANLARRAKGLGGELDVLAREPTGTRLSWRVPLSGRR